MLETVSFPLLVHKVENALIVHSVNAHCHLQARVLASLETKVFKVPQLPL